MLHRFLFLILLASCRPPAPVATQVTSASLTTLDGAPTNLARLSHGRVTVVALWATWCDACRVEMPSLLRLEAKAVQRGDFDVVSIAVGEDARAVKTFAATNRVPFSVLLDENFVLAATAQNRVPTTLVLDREGRIVHEGGALDPAALAALRREIGP